MAYEPKIWVNDESELSAENFNPMEQGIAGAYPVQLIAIDSTAPSTCSTGDKYYNTTSKKIFTATGTNTWGTNGETPLEDTVYYLINAKQTYIWDSANEVLALIGDGSTGISTDHLINVSNEVDEDYRVNLLHSKNILNNTLSTQTKNNITFTKNSDGSITLNGTASASTILTLGIVSLKSGKTYTLSGGEDLSIDTVRLDMRLSDAGSIYDNWYIPYYPTKTITNDIALYASIRVQSGASFTNKVIYPMLEEGSTATPYEPFVPNQIVVDNEKYTDTLNVGTSLDSRNRVNVLHSKNLFDVLQVFTNYNLTSSGTMEAGNGYNLHIIKVKPSTTYIMSVGSARQWVYGFYASFPTTSSTTINSQRFVVASTNETFTTPNTANYMCIREIVGGGGSNEIITNLMLNEGSTLLDYEPYITPSINVDGDEIYNQNIMNYSTNEQVIGKWIDGKPLYRKVIDCGALPNNAQKNVNHNITNIYRIIKIYGYSKTSTDVTFSLPFPALTIAGNISVFANNTYIAVSTGTDRTSFTETYITLEYTKTTD